jgi:hypothetical protein
VLKPQTEVDGAATAGFAPTVAALRVSDKGVDRDHQAACKSCDKTWMHSTWIAHTFDRPGLLLDVVRT